MEEAIIGWGILGVSAYEAYQVGISAIHYHSIIKRAEVTQRWLSALRSAETTSTTWKAEAVRFQNADGPTLLHMYYRGLPHMLVGALTADTVEKGGSE